MVLALAMTFVCSDVAASLAARQAAIVVDAKTGKVLYSADANGRRYPASLTKMMTLYLTFEAMAKTLLPRVSYPLPGAAALLAAVRVTKGRRSVYDHLMLRLHDRA